MANIKFRGTKEPARNLQEFVKLCDENWDQAKACLYDRRLDPVRDFLQELKKETGEQRYADLLQAKRKIVSENLDQDVGLERFLEETGEAEPPRWRVRPAQITLTPDQPKDMFVVEKEEGSRGFLFGRVDTSLGLKAEPHEFSDPIKAEITVTAVRFDSGTIGRIEVLVGPGEQSFKVAVKLETTSRDELQLRLRQLDRAEATGDQRVILFACDAVLEIDSNNKRAIEARTKAAPLVANVERLATEAEQLVQQGQQQLNSGHYAEAQRSAEWVLKQEPNHQKANELLNKAVSSRYGSRLAASFVFGLIFGCVSWALWLRSRVHPWPLGIYCGYIVTMTVASLVQSFLLSTNRLRSILVSILLPASQMAFLFGAWLLWRSGLLSILLAFFVGTLVYRQLYATLCWNDYRNPYSNLYVRTAR